MGLYSIEQWVKVITEGPDTAYFPTNNPLIKNDKNTEIPMEGEEEMCITSKSTLQKNINELRAQGYGVDDYNKPVLYNIPTSETQSYNPTYKSWGWYGIDRIKEAGHRHNRDGLSGFNEGALRGLTYLPTICLFLPQIYIDTVLIT